MNVRSEKGFTLVEIITVIIIIAVLITVVTGLYRDFSQKSIAVQCKSNQMSLESAQIMFYVTHALEDDGYYATQVEELYPFLIEDEIPSCQGDGDYIILPGGGITCSIPDHKR
jgi:prepilin-type N-terminal cleavage/methylation domain-containing protein